jgi:hypothetical protein
MIVSNIRLNDLAIGDKNSLMVAARILGYGKEYPIEVTCPTDISPQFEVRDFGPGITPSRMKDVFIKYAASSKYNRCNWNTPIFNHSL